MQTTSIPGRCLVLSAVVLFAGCDVPAPSSPVTPEKDVVGLAVATGAIVSGDTLRPCPVFHVPELLCIPSGIPRTRGDRPPALVHP